MTWIKDENLASEELFRKYGEDFVKISEELAKRKLYYIRRSPVAVLFKLCNLGLISLERRDMLIQGHEKIKKRDRARIRGRNLKKARSNVFERDGNKCVVCGVEERLEFAHIVPFRESKKNEEEWAVVLCKKHHKEFDKHLNPELYKKVFEHMCSCYGDSGCNYCVPSVGCEHCVKFFYMWPNDEIEGLKTFLLKNHRYRGTCNWCKNPIKDARLCHMCKNKYHSKYEEACDDCIEEYNKEYAEFEREIDEVESEAMARWENE